MINCTDQPVHSHGYANSFVSIRITSAEIKRNISMVQQEMIKVKPQMAEIIQDLAKLHITLLVLSLESDEDIERCVRVHKSIKSSIVGDTLANLAKKFLC